MNSLLILNIYDTIDAVEGKTWADIVLELTNESDDFHVFIILTMLSVWI
jgi:hypothetical protein